MRQRVRVVGLIRQPDGGILLVRKRSGRLENSDLIWELPTSKISFGEQPDEAILRAIFDEFGLRPDRILLKDVVTFVSLPGASQINNLYIIYEIFVQQNYRKYILGDKYSTYEIAKNEELDRFCLDEASNIVLGLEMQLTAKKITDDEAPNGDDITIYIDGCSKGNPGPAGVGYVIFDKNGNTIKRGGEFIGFASSRVAEYYALKIGCMQAVKMKAKAVKFISDSLTMVDQMNGVYKIKNKDLIPIYEDVCEKLNSFDSYEITFVEREKNREADREANLAVNRHFDDDMLE